MTRRLSAPLVLLAAAAVVMVLLGAFQLRSLPPFPTVRLALIAAGLGLVVSAGAWLLAREHRLLRSEWRRELEEKTRALREAGETYQAIIDHADALIFTLDPQGRYLDLNRYALAYLGATLETVRGKYVEEHLDAPGAARFREHLDQAWRTGELTRAREPLTINGWERCLDLHFKVFQPPEAREPFVLAISRDVTDQKALDERLWQTEKLASLGLLAAGVAHEVNNPLAVMMGFCELLLEQAEDGSPGRRNLSIIYEQCQQCKRIVEGLLHFTRLSNADAGPSEPLAALMTVVEALRGLLAKKGIELDLDLPDRLPPSAAGAGALQQVFLNLIGNAVDAMPEGGRLSLSARLKTKPPYQGDAHGTLPAGRLYLEFEVRDTGPGIAPEHLSRIFDPFFTTKPVDQGTGLGLSVVYGLVREHQGTITCQSPVRGERGEEQGTCFTLRLPATAPDETR
ncbi:MAG: ATP-binding protein [Thermodesulfobacteriota bacterium]